MIQNVLLSYDNAQGGKIHINIPVWLDFAVKHGETH